MADMFECNKCSEDYRDCKCSINNDIEAVQHPLIDSLQKELDNLSPYRADVIYNGLDQNLDKNIHKIAEKYSLEFTGSGAGFGQRDLSFDSFNEENVRNFQKEVKKIKNKFKLKVYIGKLVLDYEELK